MNRAAGMFGPFDFGMAAILIRAARGPASPTVDIAGGIVLVLLGGMYLVFHRQFTRLCQQITGRNHPEVCALSVYVIPAAFVVGGVVAIIHGAT